MNKLKYIFVSSTFSDFHNERDILNSQILPRINEKIRPLGYEICFIDLRWGINDLSEEDNEKYLHIINTCISEVRNSNPYFILFLGDNSGTKVNEELVKAIYKYNKIEQDISEKSITQIEVDASNIFTKDNERCLVLRRHLKNVPNKYKNKFINNVDETYENKIKNSLVNKNGFVEYDAVVKEDGNVEFDVDFIINKIEDFIVSDFIKNNASSKNKSLYEIDREIFESRIEENKNVFFGRNKYIDEFHELIKKKNIIRIAGPSGIGKSSLLLNLFENLNTENKCIFMLGNCYGKGDLSEVINYVCDSFLHATIIEKESILYNTSADALLETFYRFLHKLNPKENYYIFIDAYEKLETYGMIDKENVFSIEKLPKNVQVVLSGISFKKPDIVLGNLESNDIQGIINKKVNYYKKELPNEFFNRLDTLKDNLKLTNPILLSLAIDDLIFITREDYLKISNENYIDSLTALLLNKISNIEVTSEKEFKRKIQLLENTSSCALTYLKILAMHKKGCSLEQISEISKYLYGSFSIFNFELAKSIFSSQITLNSDGCYQISHDLFKSAILSEIDDEEDTRLREASLSYLEKYKPDDYIDSFELVKDSSDVELFFKVFNRVWKFPHASSYLRSIMNNEMFKPGGEDSKLYSLLTQVAFMYPLVFALIMTFIEADREFYYVYNLLDTVYDFVYPTVLRIDTNLYLDFAITYARSALVNNEITKATIICNEALNNINGKYNTQIDKILATLTTLQETYAVNEDVERFQETCLEIIYAISVAGKENGASRLQEAENDPLCAYNLAYIIERMFVSISMLDRPLIQLKEQIVILVNQVCGCLLKHKKDSVTFSEYAALQCIIIIYRAHLNQFNPELLAKADFSICNSLLSIKYFDQQFAIVSYLLTFQSIISNFMRPQKLDVVDEAFNLINAMLDKDLHLPELSSLGAMMGFKLIDLYRQETYSKQMVETLERINARFDEFDTNVFIYLVVKIEMKIALLYWYYYNDKIDDTDYLIEEIISFYELVFKNFSEKQFNEAFSVLKIFARDKNEKINNQHYINANEVLKAIIAVVEKVNQKKNI